MISWFIFRGFLFISDIITIWPCLRAYIDYPSDKYKFNEIPCAPFYPNESEPILYCISNVFLNKMDFGFFKCLPNLDLSEIRPTSHWICIFDPFTQPFFYEVIPESMFTTMRPPPLTSPQWWGLYGLVFVAMASFLFTLYRAVMCWQRHRESGNVSRVSLKLKIVFAADSSLFIVRSCWIVSNCCTTHLSIYMID